MLAGLATQVISEVHHIAPMVASTGTSTPPAMTADELTSATGNIFTVVSQVLNVIVSEPIFRTFFVAGLIFLGIGIIRRLKRI